MFYFELLIAISAVFVLVLKGFWKPVYQRGGPHNIRWHMPKGPSGVPIFGNLFQWRSARCSPQAFFAYVSCLPNVTCCVYWQMAADSPFAIRRDDDPIHGLKDICDAQQRSSCIGDNQQKRQHHKWTANYACCERPRRSRETKRTAPYCSVERSQTSPKSYVQWDKPQVLRAMAGPWEPFSSDCISSNPGSMVLTPLSIFCLIDASHCSRWSFAKIHPGA